MVRWVKTEEHGTVGEEVNENWIIGKWNESVREAYCLEKGSAELSRQDGA